MVPSMSDFIYLDYNASTPLAEEVLQAMMPYFTQHYGNPSSMSHSYSWAAAGGMTMARKQVAHLLHCDPSEIIFTSGATESINLALRGVLEQQPEIQTWTTEVEHAATFQTLKSAESKGYKIFWLKNEKNGLVPMDTLRAELERAPKETPKLVSFILAQNEFGSLYDLKTLSDICKEHKALLHVDATQAVLTQPLDVSKTPVDLLSFSAHKIYGPKGTGALYINKATLGRSLAPQSFGGGQEFGLRSGTPNVAGIVGMGAACALVEARQTKDQEHFKNLYHFFSTKMDQSGVKFFLNGDAQSRIFNTISITFPEHNSDTPLTLALAPFCLTQGSACGAGSTGPNRVLSALGLNERETQNTLRIGLGRHTSVSELEKLVEKLQQVI